MARRIGSAGISRAPIKNTQSSGSPRQIGSAGTTTAPVSHSREAERKRQEEQDIISKRIVRPGITETVRETPSSVITIKEYEGGRVEKSFNPKLPSGRTIDSVKTTSTTARINTGGVYDQTAFQKSIARERLKERAKVETVKSQLERDVTSRSGGGASKVLSYLKSQSGDISRVDVERVVRVASPKSAIEEGGTLLSQFQKEHGKNRRGQQVYKVTYSDSDENYERGKRIAGVPDRLVVRAGDPDPQSMAELTFPGRKSGTLPPRISAKEPSFFEKSVNRVSKNYADLQKLNKKVYPGGRDPVSLVKKGSGMIANLLDKTIGSEKLPGAVRPPLLKFKSVNDFLIPGSTGEVILVGAGGRAVQKGAQYVTNKISRFSFKTSKKGLLLSIKKAKTPMRITKFVGTGQRVDDANTGLFLEKGIMRFRARVGKKTFQGTVLQSTSGKKTTKRGFEKFVTRQKVQIDDAGKAIAESTFEGVGRSTSTSIKTVGKETLPGGKTQTVGYFAKSKKVRTALFPEAREQAGVSYVIQRKGANKAVLRVGEVSTSRAGLIGEDMGLRIFRLEGGSVSTKKKYNIINEFVGSQKKRGIKIKGIARESNSKPFFRGKKGQLASPKTEVFQKPRARSGHRGSTGDRIGSEAQIERLLNHIGRPARAIPRRAGLSLSITASHILTEEKIDSFNSQGIRPYSSSRSDSAIRNITRSQSGSRARNLSDTIQKQRNNVRQRTGIRTEQYQQRIQKTFARPVSRQRLRLVPPFSPKRKEFFVPLPKLSSSGKSTSRRFGTGYEERLYRIRRFAL